MEGQAVNLRFAQDPGGLVVLSENEGPRSVILSACEGSAFVVLNEVKDLVLRPSEPGPDSSSLRSSE